MQHSNAFVSFLRHYGPIPASDNMYDELIEKEIKRYGIDPPLKIDPPRLPDLIKNFKSASPKNVILTGTAGDGKTYHCRRVWEVFNGDQAKWNKGQKVVELLLPASLKTLTIIKDLSELTVQEKENIIPKIAKSIHSPNPHHLYLVAANDGQLVASWREFAIHKGSDDRKDFDSIQDMLIKGEEYKDPLSLYLYNLSRSDSSKFFGTIVSQVTEHPHWKNCAGCKLMPTKGTTRCPIRINRDRLRRDESGFVAIHTRMEQLLRLAAANRMYMPIRDLLLLCVNIVLGDSESSSQKLLDCSLAHDRAKTKGYRHTNPYANAFGGNLEIQERQQYRIFEALESFGIGIETDKKSEQLLVYEASATNDEFNSLVGKDTVYGGDAYNTYLTDYLEGDRAQLDKLLEALAVQRQRLFFILPQTGIYSPWRLSIYHYAGLYLEFVRSIPDERTDASVARSLVRGLNRTFCGMMTDESDRLYFTSSGGDGRGRVAPIFDFEIGVREHPRNPYVGFRIERNTMSLRIVIVDPEANANREVAKLALQLTHFEFLLRVANGSLPASFSQQCYEDFLDFKLRAIKTLAKKMREPPYPDEVNIIRLSVDGSGQTQRNKIQIKLVPK